MQDKWYQIKEQAAGEKRLLLTWYIYNVLGKKAVKFITFFVALYVYCFSKQIRISAKNNVSVIRKFCIENGKDVSSFDKTIAFKNVLNYAYSLVDKMEIFAGKYDVNKISFDKEELRKIFFDDIKKKKGIFLICSHNGNINIARMLLKSEKFYTDFKVNVFLSESQCKIFDSFIKKIKKSEFENVIETFPIEKIGIDTSILLKEKTENGEIAFMAGDRLSSGTSNLTFQADFFGRKVEFPQGTFKLAQLMETPIYFICALKDRHDSYKIYLEKFDYAGDKKDTIVQMQKKYVDFVQSMTLLDPSQFYHFYPLFLEE